MAKKAVGKVVARTASKTAAPFLKKINLTYLLIAAVALAAIALILWFNRKRAAIVSSAPPQEAPLPAPQAQKPPSDEPPEKEIGPPSGFPAYA